MKQENKRGGFSGTLVGTLGSILLGNLLSEKGIVTAGFGNKKGKGIVIKTKLGLMKFFQKITYLKK